VPRLGMGKRSRQAVLKGDIPSPYSIPPGCRFQTRCPKAQAICRSVVPPSIQLSATHVADCHFTT